MSKETIPQSVLNKIDKQYPDVIGLAWQQNVHAQRQAAIWGAFELDKWISVKDGLPEVDKWLLLYNGHWTGVGKYKPNPKNDDEPAWRDETSAYIYPEPTHYQYLPKPPKDI